MKILSVTYKMSSKLRESILSMSWVRPVLINLSYRFQVSSFSSRLGQVLFLFVKCFGDV